MRSDARTMDDKILAGIVAVVSGLAAAVGALFKINESKNTKALESQGQALEVLKQQAEKCEEDRVELRVRMARLEAKAGDGEQ